jgi:arabinogalactan endo-1,4-beta-galactosidase
VLGVSHYFKWSTVATLPEVGAQIKALKAKYGKQVMVVETAYPWTGQNADTYTNIIAGDVGASGYGVSKEEQLRYMKDLVQQVKDAGGNGVQYWEPAWITSKLRDRWGTGSSWENCALFDFSGNVLPGMDFGR